MGLEGLRTGTLISISGSSIMLGTCGVRALTNSGLSIL